MDHSKEPLIDADESKALKKGKIDVVKDGRVNSQMDFWAFLAEQRDQAVDMLKKQANELFMAADSDEGVVFSPKERAVLDEALMEVEKLFQQQSRLTVQILKVISSKMSDIVGFELVIDKNGMDQFGLGSREKGKSYRTGYGFHSYKKEVPSYEGKYYLDSYGDSDGTLNPGALDVAKNLHLMSKLDVSKNDLAAVMKRLKQDGHPEYTEYSENQKGPVLVILPEEHRNLKFIRPNATALIDLKDYANVFGYEESGAYSNSAVLKKGQGLKDLDFSKIDEVKDVVDAFARQFQLNQLPMEITGVNNLLHDKRAKKYLDVSAKRFNEFLMGLSSDERIKTWAKFGEIHRILARVSVPRDIYDALLDYREEIWLNRIQNVMANERDLHSSQSNFVFVACGLAHAEGLKNKAASRGFKASIIYWP